jgi:hypothetical protein
MRRMFSIPIENYFVYHNYISGNNVKYFGVILWYRHCYVPLLSCNSYRHMSIEVGKSFMYLCYSVTVSYGYMHTKVDKHA